MNRLKMPLVLAALISMPMVLFAAEQTVVLKVEGMTCQSCPYQVKGALKKVEGVITANASLKTREAEVTFDDAITDIAALTQATSDAGFPSTLRP